MQISTDSHKQPHDDVAKWLATILNQSMRFIQSSAHNAVHIQGRENDEFVILCVEVDDVFGSTLVEEMMPYENWQKIRDRGEKPVMHCIGSSNMCYELAENLPALKNELTEPPPPDAVKIIIIASGACLVYYVTLMPKYGLN